ncbi:alpha/beta fold hydrolase [Solimonas sp. SE-A11]|uniref:alpha/beta fold hydrolase n=1 Tax=Solimonas sp. SE-A11 TaxID=3054954 RepID=UPI00259C977D|nr:alpha/beta hydrolase [Solimonas sp. SE-A11]MDM4769648.1 alpha/beta hydrolase [Solimonas sp. SE-A11]
MTYTLSPRWIRANGLEFAYLEAGEGPLVLCLHGFPDTAWSFEPVVKSLAAAGFRAVAVFMRGYAPTALPADGDYRITTLGRDVIALIDHFGVDKAHVVGHDWGAAAAYTAAALRPDRIHRIATAAVPHLRRFLLRPALRQLKRSRYMGFFQLPLIPERRIRAQDFAWLRALIHEWSPDWNFTDAEFEPLRALFSEPERLRAALGYYRAMPRGLLMGESWQTLMKPIAVPTRVIVGENDGCIGREMFLGQDHLFSAGYERIEMAGCGHFMHCEQPQAFADLLIEFFKRG